MKTVLRVPLTFFYTAGWHKDLQVQSIDNTLSSVMAWKYKQQYHNLPLQVVRLSFASEKNLNAQHLTFQLDCLYRYYRISFKDYLATCLHMWGKKWSSHLAIRSTAWNYSNCSNWHNLSESSSRASQTRSDQRPSQRSGPCRQCKQFTNCKSHSKTDWSIADVLS